MKQILREITQSQLKQREAFKVGDGVKVHTKVREGDKERIQIFKGVVIAMRGTGIEESFTVRRIASGVGVERVFPLHSPNIEKIELDRESVVGRARIYYLRDRVGKEATKVNEKRLLEVMGVTAETPEEKAAVEAQAKTKAEESAKLKVAKEQKKAADKTARAEKKAAKVSASTKSDKKPAKAEKADKKAVAKK
jgi:large subunit ribosomal protein L19